MLTDEWVKFTKEESDAIEVAALHAARLCIKAPDEYGDSQPPGAAMIDIVKAFLAVHQVELQAKKDKETANPGKNCCGPYIDAHPIVATAVYFSFDQTIEPHPYSGAGAQLVAYAQACRALSAMSALDGALSDPRDLYDDSWASDLLAQIKARDGGLEK